MESEIRTLMNTPHNGATVNNLINEAIDQGVEETWQRIRI
jgi:hypothetical protein